MEDFYEIEETEGLFSGWLEKLGEKGVQLWKKRFFVLQDDALYYYKDDSCRIRKGFWKFSHRRQHPVE